MILASEKCTDCRRDSPRATEADVQELKLQIPKWALVEREGIQRLERVFRFRIPPRGASFCESCRALEHATDAQMRSSG